ncbi:MAG: hemerythrin domain-containing protein [Gammaproteobacteria bacterium]|nr:hemerythrin domain-containing protein [Gammaproteobacteria bacterium]
MHSFMQQLHEEHANVARLLAFIRQQVEELPDDEQPDYEHLHQVMHYLTHYPDVFHHPREDALFALLEKKDPSCHAAVRQLKREHDTLASDGDNLRQRLNAKLQGKRLQWRTLSRELHEYAELLENHMEMEERKVFPLAKLLLTEREWDDIAAKLRKRQDPIFGESATSPYASLLNEIERGSSRH